MPRSVPLSTLSGAGMDAAAPFNGRRRLAIAFALTLFAAFATTVFWSWIPRGLSVPLTEVQLAKVAQGTFLDQLLLRATVTPVSSVILDSVESGRVEEVLVQDGARVKAGDILFRLTNPQRQLELLARQSDHAQQLSNLSNLRVGLEASRIDHQRRLSDLEFSASQSEKQHARNIRLATQGFISTVALEESADRLAQQRRSLSEEQLSAKLELETKRNAMTQMGAAINRLESGLKLVNATVDALVVRAPVSGRLIDFGLQVGATVLPGQHFGRIDDPSDAKLSAQVDEYYLNRVTDGLSGHVRIKSSDFQVIVNRIFPQIKDGRFAIELKFANDRPSQLNPGQGVDAIIPLGLPTSAMILPNGPFIQDGGGAWVFVLASDGKTAMRRTIQLGRRNNGQLEVKAGLDVGEQVVISSYAPYGNATQLVLTQ